ncbi:ABC transporter ecdL [Beauveria bassiana]|nr:ABC transporter ecdL [Beauveria bassiana]
MATTDDSFGPQLPGHFDFTLLFEQTMFSILPCGIFLLAVPCRLAQLRKRRISIGLRKLLCAKLLATLAIWGLPSTVKVRASIAAAVLGLVEAAAIFALSHFEHTRAPSQAVLLNIYLIVSSILNIAAIRTAFIHVHQPSLAGVLTAALASRLCLLALEECPKAALATLEPQSRETRAGVISRGVFWWLNSFLVFGYNSVLDVNHLGPIAAKFDSQDLRRKLESIWSEDTKLNNWALLKCTFMAYKGQFAAGVVPRLLYSGFTLSQPFLINSVIAYVATPDEKNRNEGACLVGATVLLYTGLTITNSWYRHATYQLLTMYRGGLVSLVFKKTLELEGSSIRNLASITLMSTDVEGIVANGTTIHDIWAAFIELPISLFMLYRQVRIPSLFILIPALLTTICGGIIAPTLGPAKVLWNDAVQERVSDTSNMLSQIKGVKMMGLTNFFLKRLQEKRAHELRLSVKFRWIQVYLHGLATLSSSLTPVIVILSAIFWTRSNQGLSVAEAFTSLSIITIAAAPILHILVSMMQLFGVVGCFTRLQNYLLSEARKDPRNLKQQSQNVPVSNSQNSAAPQTTASQDIEMDSVSETQLPSVPAIRFSDATFRIGEKKDVLRNISTDICRGTLSMVVGRVGCGKSSFLKAIVGELPLDSGTLDSEYPHAAYCDQTPWVFNATIEENIVGHSACDAQWFQTVLHSCCIDEDIESFVNGAQTLVGSGGISLSGGQKQRVALARSAYMREQFVVLDDVFSGLDNKTAKTVFNRLLGRDGLLRNTGQTIILATNNVNFLSAADSIIMLEGGCIVRNQVPYHAFAPSEWGVLEETIDVAFETAATTTTASNQKFATPLRRAEINTEENTREIETELSRQTGDIDCYKIYLRSLGGAIGLALINVISFNFTLSSVIVLWTQLETSLGAIARLKWFNRYTPNENKPEEIEMPAADWPSQGQIELDNVVAAYSEEGEDILRGVTLSFEPGTKIGVCGRSGSGKSSLIAALSRLLELRGSGSIRIDGVDLATVTRQDICSRIIAFPQDAFLLPGTVRHNLDPEEKVEADEVLIQALTKVAIWSFLETRGGLDARLENLGFSAGQLQLLCLARFALRRESSRGSGGVVLLDEATNSIDSQTDDEVRAALRPDMEGMTVLEVVHRLEILRDYDVVVVMERGQVAETGKPDKLLATPGSKFEALWNSKGL